MSELSDYQWNYLLKDVHEGRVVPILGPSASLVIDQEDGQEKSFYQWLAPRLARHLKVKDAEGMSLNEVACAFMIMRNQRSRICHGIQRIVEEEAGSLEIPQSVKVLTSITDFRLFLTSSFDPFLEDALASSRQGFQQEQHTLGFHPARPRDLPQPTPSTCLYHILGRMRGNSDFAVWDEDFVEYICGFIKTRDNNLEQLSMALGGKSLLLIGSPFNDWIVRFFLRAIKGGRLTTLNEEDSVEDYIADNSSELSADCTLFFSEMSGYPTVIAKHPQSFVEELGKRWQERYGDQEGQKTVSVQVSKECKKDAVFISYSRDDKEKAKLFYKTLSDNGIPAWLDLVELNPGGAWARQLQIAVVSRCSMFISLISASTEEDAGKELKDRRFAHEERSWAARKQVDGAIFYIPVIIDDLKVEEIKAEPDVYDPAMNVDTFPSGEPSAEFLDKIRHFLNKHKMEGYISDH